MKNSSLQLLLPIQKYAYNGSLRSHNPHQLHFCCWKFVIFSCCTANKFLFFFLKPFNFYFFSPLYRNNEHSSPFYPLESNMGRSMLHLRKDGSVFTMQHCVSSFIRKDTKISTDHGSTYNGHQEVYHACKN